MLVRSLLTAFGLCAAASLAAGAAELVDPPMLPAQGPPDLLMVARPQLLPLTGQPAGYVYEVCSRPADPAARRCPVAGHAVDLHACPTAADPAVSPYGGVRLQLHPGQTLRIRLVNCLPPTVDAKHAEGDPLLQANPTNLHTHGLIVEPRRADDADDPFGDYVFVLDLPPGIHPPAATPAMPGHDHNGDHARNFDFREQVVDYAIPIPPNHPAGLFWFHPHVHGLALNQVTGGLAGIITVGDVHSYACDHGATCAPGQLASHVRHLVFKDTQVTSDFRLRFQENPAMCATPDAAGNVGGCAGAGQSSGTATENDDGRWAFTVNGQTYPDITVHSAGEIWRMANESASATYNLGVFPPGAEPQPLVFQVLAIDGVSLVLPPGVTPAQANRLLGDKMTVVPCPDTPPAGAAAPVCATSLRMMPSARAEIFVRGNAAEGTAVLRTVHRQTGPAGDDWPTIDLARLIFPPPQPAAARPAVSAHLSVAPEAFRALAAGGVFAGPVTTRLDAAAPPVPVASLTPQGGTPTSPAQQARARTLQAAAGPDCTPLRAGEVRQVLFGVPADADFGLGYRRVAATDTNPPASADAVPIVAFDHAAPPTVCVPLGPHAQAVTETWMLVNLAGEDHNFHIHQTRFSVVATPGDGETTLPPVVNGQAVLLDNVPLPHGTGDGCDGTVAQWIAGACKPTIVTVSIPLHEVGDFVFHCHILEHEDGGMMAKISVVPLRR
jgi:FtsP/CotA-like multicopper oxidase with cupredoxin domain